MANDSLTTEVVCRQIPTFQSIIAKNLHTLQGLLFLSCEMFEMLHEIDESAPVLKRWRDLAVQLLDD